MFVNFLRLKIAVPNYLNNEDIIMTTYNKQFELSIKDVDLIERSLRFQISHLARTETLEQTQQSIENHNKIIELMNVLSIQVYP